MNQPTRNPKVRDNASHTGGGTSVPAESESDLRQRLDAAEKREREEQERHAQLQSRCYEGFPTVSDGIFDALKESRQRERQLAAALEAANRIVENKYIEWAKAGGVNDCKHGRGEGIPCLECDRQLITSALSAPSTAAQDKHETP